MKKVLFILSVAVMTVMFLGSCQEDEKIDTTQFEGSWFVTKIEMIDATSLDDSDYQTKNSRTYNETTPANGSLLFIVSETSSFNEYVIRLFKHDGSKWNSQHQQNVKLSSNNKFTFFSRECKLKKSRETVIEVKARYGSDYYRYTLSRTLLAP